MPGSFCWLRLAAAAVVANLASSCAQTQTQLQQQPHATLDLPRRGATQRDDWLAAGAPLPNSTARLLQLDARTIALSNGLVARVFTVSPEWSTWDIVTAGKGSALRAPAPEAVVTLDGVEYEVGGLRIDLNASAFAASCKASHDNWYPSGQHAEACPTGWWNRSLPLFQNLAAFRYSGHRTTAPEAPFAWVRARHAPPADWPPCGLHLEVNFTAPNGALSQHRGIIISVHYQLLDGAPVISKWVSVAWAEPPRRRRRVQSAVPSRPRVVSDSLAGPLTIQPCNTSPTAAPAEWGFVWQLPRVGNTNASIRLGGKSSGRDICMTVMTASVGFSNADVGLVACNSSDVMQRWAWDNSSGALRTLAPASRLRAANIKGCLAARACCVDVNAHSNQSGTCLQMDECDADQMYGSPWEGFRPLKSALGTMLQSVASPASCIISTPVAPSPPPLPPSPPPPPPTPKPACPSGDCVVVRHITVEILRLNKAWASAERAMPYEQTDITQDVLPFDSSVSDGLLYIRPTALHGSSVLWSDDMTFRDPDYVATNNAGAVPTVIVGYQSNRSCGADIYGAHKEQCRFGGPGFRLRHGGAAFTSFRALELWSDSAEPERKGLGQRAMTRLLAPQSQEAPFTFHTGTTDTTTFKTLVDQLSNVGGFDLLMMSFGSGFTMEDTSPASLSKIGELISYSRSKGIEVGGYDLIAEKPPTGAEAQFAVLNPNTNAPTGALCFASGWRRQLTQNVLTWVNNQSLTAIETDGPYGGAVCGSHEHDHYGAHDSVYLQQQGQVEFYKAMRAKGVYVNAPDDYLFEGGANKVCGGYTMFSSTRSHWEMLYIQRVQMYDQLFVETPSMEWMLAPLDPYGGSPHNGLEPLAQNIEAYNWTLGSYLGYGLSGACFRGHRVYDSPAVEVMVKMWTGFWQMYRTILVKDVVHVKRPDYQSIDAVMHVDANRSAAVCALLMVYNPTSEQQQTVLSLDMYYTGEGEAVTVAEHGQASRPMRLARDYTVALQVSLPAMQMTYYVVTRP